MFICMRTAYVSICIYKFECYKLNILYLFEYFNETPTYLLLTGCPFHLFFLFFVPVQSHSVAIAASKSIITERN